MSQAKNGDSVKVHYTGTLEDGTVFDSSLEREPMEFTVGNGQLIPGFEQGVIGLAPGDSKTVKIPADQAYGPRREDLQMTVDPSRFPEHIKPELGLQLQVPQEDGHPVLVTITNITDAEVTLDANHPLAGKDLTFEIRLMEIA